MPSDTLTTIAEVAIALAGFASVVVALQRRFDDAGSVHHAQLWRLLEASLATTAFALLPIVLENAGLSHDAVWQVTSLGLACWGATTTALVLHRHRRRLAIDKSLWRFNGPMPALVVTAAVCLVLSAFDIGLPRGPRVYVGALYAYLLLAATMFWRLFFPPKGLH
jgi:hypothetical protein